MAVVAVDSFGITGRRWHTQPAQNPATTTKLATGKQHSYNFGEPALPHSLDHVRFTARSYALAAMQGKLSFIAAEIHRAPVGAP
jgi:hypothetical protein